MWQVDNRTPFAAERGWVRDRNGAEVWLVAVKCTFDIRPDGTTEVSEGQPPVLGVPEQFGEPGKSIADDWDEPLMPETLSQQAAGQRVTFRADAAFTNPEIYEALETGGVRYAIRIPAHKTLELEIEALLFRTAGRASRTPVVRTGFLVSDGQLDHGSTGRDDSRYRIGELFPQSAAS